MMKKFLLFFTIAFGVLEANAQDPELTQFYAAPVYTNPAMAGTGQCDGGGRVAINYRNQWPKLPGTFITYTASYDQHFQKLGGAVGLLAMRDQAGEGLLTSTHVAGVYSYLLPINRKVAMRFGIQAEYGSRSIDWQRLRFEDQIDPRQGFVNSTAETFNQNQVNYANFAAGGLIYTEKFYAGVAVHNLIEPNQSFFGDPKAIVPRRYTVHAGMDIPLDKRRNPKSTMSPNILFMMQDQFTQLNFGMYINRGPLVTGLWYRQTLGDFKNSDALIALVGFRKDKFKFGFSYDLTVSDARVAAPGSFEVTAAMEWCAKRRPRGYPRMKCPDF